MSVKTLLSPERSGSGTCVQVRDAGGLYVQSFDAYGFQREMTLKEAASGTGWVLQVYQHPGRRQEISLTLAQGRKLLAAFVARAESDLYFPLLWNPEALGNPKNRGFVRFQEAVFRMGDGLPTSAEFAQLLSMV